MSGDIILDYRWYWQNLAQGVIHCFSSEKFQLICKHLPQQTTLPSKEIQPNVKNTNVRKNCQICPKLTIKTLKRSQWCNSGVFIVNFELISHLFLVFSLLPLNKKIFAGRLWLFLAVFADTLQVLLLSPLMYNVPNWSGTL